MTIPHGDNLRRMTDDRVCLFPGLTRLKKENDDKARRLGHVKSATQAQTWCISPQSHLHPASSVASHDLLGTFRPESHIYVAISSVLILEK